MTKFLLAALAIALSSTACAPEDSYTSDRGDRSDDLGGRSVEVVAPSTTQVGQGTYQVDISLEERQDGSVTIFSEAFVIPLNGGEYSLKEPAPLISFNTTSYGFLVDYRSVDSNAQWQRLQYDFVDAIFREADITLASNDETPYAVAGQGYTFGEFSSNSLTSDNVQRTPMRMDNLPADAELRITPIPVFNVGDFEDNYNMEFEIRSLL